MSATFREARDDILGAFKAAWDETGYFVAWPQKPAEPPADQVEPQPWARITIEHARGFQASLASDQGLRRWERRGFVVTQVFAPGGAGTGETYDLAKRVVDAFQGKKTAHGVWFRNVRIQERGASGPWFQVNVVVEFTYDELA